MKKRPEIAYGGAAYLAGSLVSMALLWGDISFPLLLYYKKQLEMGQKTPQY